VTVYRLPGLDKAAPIVDPQGRITPYFQRFWQNLSFTAIDGANQSSDVAALQSAVTTINGQISTINTSLAGKVAKSTFTSWAAATGTAERTTFATYTAPTISASPTQVEVQAIADHVQILSRRLKALIDDLIA
jgi:cell wall-associated NlpC family hydrolase